MTAISNVGWMSVQQWIVISHLVIVRLLDCLDKCASFLLRIELFSNEGRPKVLGRLCRPSKSLLQLAWMEQVDEAWGVALARQDDLLLCFWVDESLGRLVEESLSPAHIYIAALVHEEHQIGLANLAKSHDLLPWKRGHCQVAKVTDHDPLLGLAWHEHDVLDIDKEEAKELLEDLDTEDLWLLLIKLGHQVAVHNEGGSVPLVPPMQVETPRRQQSNGHGCEARLWWQILQPLKMLYNLQA